MPSVGIGSSTRTSASLTSKRQSPLLQRGVRAVDRERQDRATPASIASRNAPSLNSFSSPSCERVPSGKIITLTFLSSRSRHAAIAATTLSRSPADEADVAGHPHHPSDERVLEEVLLRQPLHLPRQVRDQQDVDEALVVGDDDVRPSRVGDHRARGAEPPQRVEHLVHDGQLAEQVAGCVATLVERRGDQPTIADERQPDDDHDAEHEPRPHRDDRPDDAAAEEGAAHGSRRRCGGHRAIVTRARRNLHSHDSRRSDELFDAALDGPGARLRAVLASSASAPRSARASGGDLRRLQRRERRVPAGCVRRGRARSRRWSSGGERSIVEVVVVTDGEALSTCCGGCRQKLREFAPPEDADPRRRPRTGSGLPSRSSSCCRTRSDPENLEGF